MEEGKGGHAGGKRVERIVGGALRYWATEEGRRQSRGAQQKATGWQLVARIVDSSQGHGTRAGVARDRVSDGGSWGGRLGQEQTGNNKSQRDGFDASITRPRVSIDLRLNVVLDSDVREWGACRVGYDHLRHSQAQSRPS